MTSVLRSESRRVLVVATLVLSGSHVLLAGCGAHSTPATTSAAGPTRVVCAAAQGPRKLSRLERGPKGAEVATEDGRLGLFFVWHGEVDAKQHEIELRGGGPVPPAIIAPNVNPPNATFRGANVIGFAASKHPVFGQDGFIAWATTERRAVFARPVASSVVEAGRHVYFADASCRVHALDLETGEELTGPIKTCHPFRAWGIAIAIAEPRHSEGSRLLAGYDYGTTVVDPATGRPAPRPFCPHTVGASCITLDSDVHWRFDEDPAGPASEPSRLETFEVRGARGESVKGTIEIPNLQLSPDHVALWQDVPGRAMALVAARVEGAQGPQLVVVEDAKVTVTPLSAEEAIDQRRIRALHGFVPAGTPAADREDLARERRAALAKTADRVRFVAYPEAEAAHIPCTTPPP